MWSWPGGQHREIVFEILSRRESRTQLALLSTTAESSRYVFTHVVPCFKERCLIFKPMVLQPCRCTYTGIYAFELQTIRKGGLQNSGHTSSHETIQSSENSAQYHA